MPNDTKSNKSLGRPLFTSYVFQFDPNNQELGGDPGGHVGTIGGGPNSPVYVIYTWPFTLPIEDLNDPAPPKPG